MGRRDDRGGLTAYSFGDARALQSAAEIFFGVACNRAIPAAEPMNKPT
jgi:hypothetical protein